MNLILNYVVIPPYRWEKSLQLPFIAASVEKGDAVVLPSGGIQVGPLSDEEFALYLQSLKEKS